MQVFVFDWMAYGQSVDKFRVNGEMPKLGLLGINLALSGLVAFKTMTAKPAHAEAAKFSLSSRFEGQPGSNPEELIASAHAACYSMFLSALLSGAGHVPDSIDTTATE